MVMARWWRAGKWGCGDGVKGRRGNEAEDGGSTTRPGVEEVGGLCLLQGLTCS